MILIILSAAAALTRPDPVALEVAGLIAGNGYAALSVAPEAEVAAKFQRALLNTMSTRNGIQCDGKDPRCIAAAEAIARRNAPLFNAAVRKAAVEAVAVQLKEGMSAADLASARIFLRSPSGSAFATSLQRLISPSGEPQRYYPTMTAISQRVDALWSRDAMLDEFHTATRGLPRSEVGYPPPPGPPK